MRGFRRSEARCETTLVLPVPVSPVRRTGSFSEMDVAIRERSAMAGLCIAKGREGAGV